MSEESIPATATRNTAVQILPVSMICAVVSALSLTYSGDIVFFKLGTFEDLSKVIKVAANPLSTFAYDYGMVVWAVLLIVTVLAFGQGFRRPFEKRSRLVNFVVALAAVVFTFLLHYAAWDPVQQFLIGIGGLRSSS